MILTKKWRGLSPSVTSRRSTDDFFNDRYRLLLDMDEDLFPALNAHKAKENYIVEIAAPGFKKDDFNITVDDGVLTISSEYRDESNEKENEYGYLTREFRYASFSRSFTLPKDVKDERINAEYENGILRIRLPRQIPAKENEVSRTIAIH